MQFRAIQQKLAAQQQGDDLAGLLSDEEFAENLSDEEITDHITTSEAQAAIRDTHGRGASKWLAANAGIAQRTARRWLGSSPPAARRDQITALGARNATPATRRAAAARADTSTRTAVADRILPSSRRAAATLRGTQGRVSPGRTSVSYDGEPEGDRNIWTVDIDIQPVIDNLEADNSDAAADAFQDEILEAYGAGLSENLEISDFDPSLEIY